MTQSLTARLAAEVRAETARRGLKHRVIAEAIGISAAQVSQRMNGAIEWRLSELKTVADLLGVPISALIEPASASAA